MAKSSIGVDLGGTQMRAGKVQDGKILSLHTGIVNSKGSVEQVLSDLFGIIDPLAGIDTDSIGIGVPSVVDVSKGIVYDVQNIPSWKEVHLKAVMEQRYGIPVHVNNDANCFALAEYSFGQGRGYHSMVGLTIGTGLGAGVILNDRLYAGANCGAGEFGMVPYLEHCYEYYASGQFFTNVHHVDGTQVYQKALSGDERALDMYRAFGKHLGEAFKMILYTYDPEIIVVGGSLKEAWRFYADALWSVLGSFAYPGTVRKLKIELSELQQAGVLGAASLGQ